MRVENDTERNPWKEAVIDRLVIWGILRKEHEDDPEKAIQALLDIETDVALDPTVSREAHELVESGRANPYTAEASLRVAAVVESWPNDHTPMGIVPVIHPSTLGEGAVLYVVDQHAPKDETEDDDLPF